MDAENLPTGFVGEHSFEDTIARIERAVATVRSRIQVSASARVLSWSPAIERLRAAEKNRVLEEMVLRLRRGRWDHPFQDSFRALTDSRMFVEIVEQLGPDLTDSELSELVSGGASPPDDAPSSRARDREFEFFMAAVAKRAGLSVRLEEPDALVSIGNQEIALAAKRVRGKDKLARRLRKGAAQVQRSGRLGYVVIDVTQVLDPGAQFIAHWSQDGAPAKEGMGHLIARHRDALDANRGASHLGTILRFVAPLISRGPKFGTFELWSVRTSGGDEAASRRIAATILSGMTGS